ncbi:PREDICTED: interleukin-19 isoform X1 [Capra hircus]|uniref:interleukin-19 isoform X1 n=1 Tax=Capra hircus TaxID=9925 RepID=UPI00084771CB|nr:PREDICTED: interleukin-19 isoform X1 [Capra hircus]XP_017915588.1 PREDICTED: interleukin-19 isoform X1 [Capra hircus]
MKALCVSLCLLGAGLFLCSVHARGLRRCLISTNLHRMEESFRGIKTAIQAKDTFQNVTILSPSETLHGIKPLDVCCVTKNLLAFYVDRVFKDHQELNPQIMRKISSLANSFLYMQKTLQQCGGDKTDLAPALQAFPALVTCKKLCHCRQEATNATRIIHDNYDQLEVRAAAVKSLGELDVFLAWIDKHHQGTSAASRQGT